MGSTRQNEDFDALAEKVAEKTAQRVSAERDAAIRRVMLQTFGLDDTPESMRTLKNIKWLAEWAGRIGHEFHTQAPRSFVRGLFSIIKYASIGAVCYAAYRLGLVPNGK